GRVSLHPGTRAVLLHEHVRRDPTAAVDGSGAGGDPSTQVAERSPEDRRAEVDGTRHATGPVATEAGNAGAEAEAALGDAERDAGAERGAVERATEGEVPRAERRGRAQLAQVVAFGRPGRIALLPARRVDRTVAAARADLELAGGRAAVTARGVAVVAL